MSLDPNYWANTVAIKGIADNGDAAASLLPIYPFRKNSLLVMSDIHRGANISALPEHEASLTRQMAAFEHVVMNGDNFEMFYINRAFYGFKHDWFDLLTTDIAQLSRPEFWQDFSLKHHVTPDIVIEKAIAESIAFLKQFVKENPQTKLHFVLGNHELIKKFRGELDELEKNNANFEWSPEAIKIGDAMFVHGDLSIGRTTDQARKTYRIREAHGHMGWIKVLTLTLEEPGQTVVNLIRYPWLCIPKMDRWLKRHDGTVNAKGEPKLHMKEDGETKPFSMEGIHHVFFGHTHIKFSGLPSKLFPDVVYHNTGALTKTVMKHWWKRFAGHGMLEATIGDHGALESIQPFRLENDRGEQARC